MRPFRQYSRAHLSARVTELARLIAWDRWLLDQEPQNTGWIIERIVENMNIIIALAIELETRLLNENLTQS